MHEINYTDRSFNQESASLYSLSIQANSTGLSYCIYDTISNLIILFKRHRFDHVVLQSDLITSINHVLESDDTLNLRFSKVRFLGYTRQSTLVPADFFDADHANDYLTFNDAEETEGTIFNNLISTPALYNIFSLPAELVSEVTLFFKKIEFLSQTTTFLRHISRISAAFQRKSVYVGMNPEFFDIACTDQGKLLMYNTFQYTSETDLLYYILYAYKSVHFEPVKVPLVLSGELSSKLSYLDILKQYFSETRCDQETDGTAIASGLKHLNISRFLNLLNLHTCESSAEYTGEER